MRILHTVQYYWPSVGGSQGVVREISERLAARGHDVTVATSTHPDRSQRELEGVRIEEFDVHGRLATGIYGGDCQRYQQFLLDGQFDVMMNYGSQHWATDLAYELLPRLPYARVMAPVGFSGLRRPLFDAYFADLPAFLQHYDRLIFHSNVYQDVVYVRQLGLGAKVELVPNGCAENEFARARGSGFRARYGIPPNVPLLLCVGNHTGLKGHDTVIEAFRQARIGRAVLVIVGAGDPFPGPVATVAPPRAFDGLRQMRRGLRDLLRPPPDGPCTLRCVHASRATFLRTLGRKRVLLLLDASRDEVRDAYDAADLFVFASRVECSPVVLFEAMASRTPFISTACGNAAEVIEWGGGSGLLARTRLDDAGWGEGDPEDFARKIEALLEDEPRRFAMAQAGYEAWKKGFTWEKIATIYEDVYLRAIEARALAASSLQAFGDPRAAPSLSSVLAGNNFFPPNSHE